MHSKEGLISFPYVEVAARINRGQVRALKNRLSIRCNTLCLENSKEMVIFICLFVYIRTSAFVHELAHRHPLKYSDLFEDAVT